jgi:hypothetical protein
MTRGTGSARPRRVVGFGTPVAGSAARDGLAVGLFMELVVGRGFSGLALPVADQGLEARLGIAPGV